ARHHHNLRVRTMRRPPRRRRTASNRTRTHEKRNEGMDMTNYAHLRALAEEMYYYGADEQELAEGTLAILDERDAAVERAKRAEATLENVRQIVGRECCPAPEPHEHGVGEWAEHYAEKVEEVVLALDEV